MLSQLTQNLLSQWKFQAKNCFTQAEVEILGHRRKTGQSCFFVGSGSRQSNFISGFKETRTTCSTKWRKAKLCAALHCAQCCKKILPGSWHARQPYGRRRAKKTTWKHCRVRHEPSLSLLSCRRATKLCLRRPRRSRPTAKNSNDTSQAPKQGQASSQTSNKRPQLDWCVAKEQIRCGFVDLNWQEWWNKWCATS